MTADAATIAQLKTIRATPPPWRCLPRRLFAEINQTLVPERHHAPADILNHTNRSPADV